MSTKTTRQLSGEHQLILQALDALREISGRIAREDRVNQEDVRLLLEFFREFVHDYHDSKEELILLPALAAAGQLPRAEAQRRIVADHHEIHKVVAAMNDAFEKGNLDTFAMLSKQYIQLLTNHIFCEDHFLFENLSGSLDDLLDHRIWKLFEEFDPSLRERSKAKFESVVRRIGVKYTSPMCV